LCYVNYVHLVKSFKSKHALRGGNEKLCRLDLTKATAHCFALFVMLDGTDFADYNHLESQNSLGWQGPLKVPSPTPLQ